MGRKATERSFGGGCIRLLQGDITRQRADALVTAANAGLRGGGGVDGAIHRAAGPKLLEACRKIGGCPTGSAVSTPAFRLGDGGVLRVIHAVGPVWAGGASGEEDALRGAYRRSLEIAEREGCASIAFPSISTGVYGFPVHRAAPMAVRTAQRFLEREARTLTEVLFVLFDDGTHAEFVRALKALD
jgi:O-acetyl-ADP-ribose deacetylase (regulator of RNase III)